MSTITSGKEPCPLCHAPGSNYGLADGVPFVICVNDCEVGDNGDYIYTMLMGELPDAISSVPEIAADGEL